MFSGFLNNGASWAVPTSLENYFPEYGGYKHFIFERRLVAIGCRKAADRQLMSVSAHIPFSEATESYACQEELIHKQLIYAIINIAQMIYISNITSPANMLMTSYTRTTQTEPTTLAIHAIKSVHFLHDLSLAKYIPAF